MLETEAYDALGRRITITTYSGGSPTTSEIYYSTSGQVLEVDEDGSPVSQTVYSAGYVNSFIEVDQATGSPGTLDQRLYVQQDANFNVTSVTNASGTVLERYIYSPYGEQTVLNPDGTVKGDGTPASSSYNLPQGFQGMLFDPVTSDNLTPNRVYDPTLGTWTSEDPSGYVNGANLYEGLGDGPAGVVDPAGTRIVPDSQVWSESLTESARTGAKPAAVHAKKKEWYEKRGDNVLSASEEAAYNSLQPSPAELSSLAVVKSKMVNCMQFACQGAKMGAVVSLTPALKAGIITNAQAKAFAAFPASLYYPDNKEIFRKVLNAEIVSKGGRFINSPDESPPANMHEIVAFIYLNPLLADEGGYDYHFIAKCSDGEWVGKHGSLPSAGITTINKEVGGIRPPSGVGIAKEIIGAWFVPGPPPIDPVAVALGCGSSS